MPFVQRVVQPTRLAQVSATAAERSRTSRFHCTPGKCKNDNCINKQASVAGEQPPSQSQQQQQELERSGGIVLSRTTASAKDNAQQQQQEQQQQITTVTQAIIHVSQQNGSDVATAAVLSSTTTTPTSPRDVLNHTHNHTNGFACSFSYATDTEEALASPLPSPSSPPPGLSMKKLKQHVEFLSTAPSPSRSLTRADVHSSRSSSQTRLQQYQQRQQQLQRQRPQSSTAAKIVSGYEFDSISNITLSNALRQLASLVLIASDIFEELQSELQAVGDRARCVQRKIVAVERKVTAYDPKMVTVPESDLLTFAQRKTHYECDKSFRKELFTAATRPRSVRTLYEEAGKVTPPPTPATAANSPHSPHSFTNADGTVVDADGLLLDGISSTGATTAAGSDELVCTPVFGKANRKMRTRIDAEIEIRLPAAIEDLRKWTSTEALGDVTVTPDCMHHVDTSISTSMVIGDNGILTPALSPSVLSADAVDALYSINASHAADSTQLPNDINKDVPLNHRLPSPEEQCKIIALRYPAEVISVDTSGKRFQRMCMARKSTTGCYTNMADANNLNDDVQTVSRRSRSRKVRGKRRNTIAGTDQKEIQDAANGESTATGGELKNTLATAAAAAEGHEEEVRRSEKSKKFGRSKSSDVLKKDSVALPYDKGKNTLTRLNSLKQWGRNRFKFMQRSDAAAVTASDSGAHDASGSSSSNSSNSSAATQHAGADKADTSAAATAGVAKSAGAKSSSVKATAAGCRDIDDDCVVHELISQKSESRFSHERKPSYSSSEKSVSVSSSGHLKGKLQLASCGNVKLRDTSSLNRQRRHGIPANGGFAGKDEQPHSSSGNWSASSESGRASIGSEITIQPKSSASNTSLNVSSFHPGSGPPSSMMSRRRFLNTSASSSVTSEGTATPELQVADGGYPNHLDDETSSAYSCDTEGYYTSFHMDSGLRTLKEEEPPMTPLQHNQNLHTSNYSFGSQSNQTVLTAENEYELFGRGSTSTTTSSAGTVCTTLMVNGEQSSLNSVGPDVPERISSLGKLSNKSSHSNSASTSTLERSYSSSTIGSTLERTGTIKRNVNASLILATADAEDIDGGKKSLETPESQDEEFDFEQRMRRRAAQPLPSVPTVSEVECSECSDLEGVERIERIKQKTAINAKRIPSMCIITPTTSDDENQSKDGAFDPDRTLTNESSPRAKAGANAAEATLQLQINEESEYCTVGGGNNACTTPLTPTKTAKDHNLNVLKRNSNYALNNMFEKLKVVLPNIKRSPSKSSQPESGNDDLYDTAGEYVTIADISNNNRHNQLPGPKAVGASSLGIYYSNDIVRRRFDTNAEVTKGDEPFSARKRETEYVSLNELPPHLRKVAVVNNEAATASSMPEETGKQRQPVRGGECAESAQQSEHAAAVAMYAEISEVREQSLLGSPLTQHKGARVRVNSQGKIIYESDSLKRRKGAHTTFAPGPYVKETESALPEVSSEQSQSQTGSESAQTAKASGFVAKTSAAKLLLLNGGVAATRKVANVRPIVSTTPLTQVQRQQQPTNSGGNMSLSTGAYAAQNQPAYSYQENKNMLANNTNPFFQSNFVAASGPAMMPSPSTKSTSSTGSTISSTTSSTHTNSSGGSSSTSSAKDEGCQRFYKTQQHLQQQPQQQQPGTDHPPATITAAMDVTPFQRNSPIYWTLQNRRQAKPQPASVTCRDDLYATPIRRSERAAAAAARAAAAATAGSAGGPSNISPIVPRSRGTFQTSTPTREDDALAQDSAYTPSKQPLARSAHWDDNSPERFNTCSDRIGHSKTSLMDFKKLLLAKSTKSSPVQKKVSAVELLKKANTPGDTPSAGDGNVAATTVPSLNSSMKLLELSGSPKTFANRRMLRQGQFGSPSKSFAPKLKSSPGGGGGGGGGNGWRGNAVQRTDIISTTIPEANSEEDHSNSTNSSSSSSKGSSCAANSAVEQQRGGGDEPVAATAAQRFDLKRNFFLQTEENNFMRGELKPVFGKGTAAAVSTNKYVSGPMAAAAKASPLVDASNYDAPKGVAVSAAVAAAPALETAL